jgi:hypothetical protein
MKKTIQRIPSLYQGRGASGGDEAPGAGGGVSFVRTSVGGTDLRYSLGAARHTLTPSRLSYHTHGNGRRTARMTMTHTGAIHNIELNPMGSVRRRGFGRR